MTEFQWLKQRLRHTCNRTFVGKNPLAKLCFWEEVGMALRNAKMDKFKIRKFYDLWPQLFIQQSFNMCLLYETPCPGYKNKTK